MTTANELWFDALVRHQIGLMRLSAGNSAKVIKLLNASEAEVRARLAEQYAAGMSTKRLDSLLAAIENARGTSFKAANGEWTDQMLGLTKLEPIFLDATLKSVVPVTLSTTMPTVETLNAIAKNTPFQGRILSEWSAGLQAGEMDRMEASIRMGMSQGESTADITRRLLGSKALLGVDGATQITRNYADSITRTAVNAVSNATKQEYYEQNPDLFQEELFVATLDARTTIVCASNDGKRFKVGKGPRPPLHWRCRSLRIAIILDEVIGTRPVRNFTEQQLKREFAGTGKSTGYKAWRARRVRELTGTAPARLTYNEWLKRQSARFQDDILGPTRGRLFRENKLSLDKFVNRNGKTYTIKQLKEMDAEHLAPKGWNPSGENAPSKFSLRGKTLTDLGALPADELTDRAATLKGLRESKEFMTTGRAPKSFDKIGHEVGIQVHVDSDGSLVLIDGRHRFSVAKELGLPSVWGTIRKAGTGKVLFQGNIPI